MIQREIRFHTLFRLAVTVGLLAGIQACGNSVASASEEPPVMLPHPVRV